MKANTIEEYFGTLQQSMVESWKDHLKTDKYSKHKALNEFYDEIVEKVDALIEEYQGLHEKVEGLKNILTTDKIGTIEYLNELRELAEDGKEKFFKDEDELKSDVDAILSLIDSTLYKLKELDEHNGLMNIADYIREKLVTEGATNWKANYMGSTVIKGFDMMNVGIRPKHKYGFMSYSEDAEVCSLIAVDSIEDFCDGLSIDEDWVKPFFAMKVGDVYRENSGYGTMTMRIW